jgi:hypothetical protein
MDKQWIKEKGMDFSCYLMDFIGWLKGLTGEFTSKQIETENWRWKIFVFLDWLEFIPNNIFTYFYRGSRQEIRDALTLELGEDLNHYNSYQQQLIKAIGLL